MTSTNKQTTTTNKETTTMSKHYGTDLGIYLTLVTTTTVWSPADLAEALDECRIRRPGIESALTRQDGKAWRAGREAFLVPATDLGRRKVMEALGAGSEGTDLGPEDLAYRARSAGESIRAWMDKNLGLDVTVEIDLPE